MATIENGSTLRAQDESFRRYWPFAAGGLVSPVLAIGLTQWMPLHFAAGIVAFTIFTIANWLFLRASLRARQDSQPSLGRSLRAGLASGLVTGVLAYLVPWK